MEGTLETLLDLFNAQLSRFKRHTYNIRQQFAFSRALKQELSTGELKFKQSTLVHLTNKPHYILVCCM